MKIGTHASTAAAIALAASLLHACAARATSSPTPSPTGADSSMATIAGTEWTLVELDGKAIGGIERRPTLSIESGRVAGFAGCNRFGAEIQSKGGETWALGPVAATRMACEEAEMVLERDFLSALSAATSWRVDQGRLLLVGPDGKARLAFTGQRPG